MNNQIATYLILSAVVVGSALLVWPVWRDLGRRGRERWNHNTKKENEG